MSSKHDQYLSKLERERFAALSTCNSVKLAAAKLGMNEQTMYNWLYQLRKKYNRRRGWVNSVLSQRKRSTHMKRLLTERRPLKAVEDEEENYDYNVKEFPEENE